MKANQVVRSAAESPISFKGYRFPPDIISYAVWLYYRFRLSLRTVEALLAARGIELTYETGRSWATKFGQAIARRIRSTAPGRGDKWHLDEVVVTINGTKHWLWRAVDRHGAVLEVLVQRRRDQAAAKRLMCKLRSYAAATTELGLSVEHRQHKGLNNRAENSH
ncbi:transposase, partial [Burkholderia ubonensis]|uniref:IS6 family transposase n=1 Tax=Burkholderia ubonensis TaxID=101571 RepID=UPI0007586874